MSELLPCVEIEPRGAARGSVVWMHGLGASGHDFEDLVPMLELPGVRFVFPHAPQHAVTINAGLIMPAWYDITLMSSTGGENPRHVRQSAGMIRALIEREQQRGVPAERIVIAGFSQGGAMALYVGLRYPLTLGGIMVLSGYEVLADTREPEASPANRATPLLFCHGISDPMVYLRTARDAYDALKEGRPAEWHEFPMAHQVCLEEVAVIRTWLHERLDEEEAAGRQEDA
jgi:phospholipase/carboxylesterase